MSWALGACQPSKQARVLPPVEPPMAKVALERGSCNVPCSERSVDAELQERRVHVGQCALVALRKRIGVGKLNFARWA